MLVSPRSEINVPAAFVSTSQPTIRRTNAATLANLTSSSRQTKAHIRSFSGQVIALC